MRQAGHKPGQKGKHAMKKTIRLHTYDLQRIVIGCISEYAKRKRTDPTEAAAYEAIADTFAELNRHCTESNDYTLTVEVNI